MLSLAAQRILVQDPSLLATGLIGVDSTWTQGWVFPDKPRVLIENTQKCAVVLFEDDPWTDPNPHNRAEFATLVADIWADPTRNADKSVRKEDAEDKIRAVLAVLDRNFHLVHPSVPRGAPAYLGQQGMPRIWGTAAQVAARSGLTIVESKRASGPKMNPMANNPGGYRGRVEYHIQYH